MSKRILTLQETHMDPNAPTSKSGNEMLRCERCYKWVKWGGLTQHRRDVHGASKRAKAKEPQS